MQMSLAFLGVVLLFGEPLWEPKDQAWRGDLMILGGAVLWAATTLTIKASTLARASAEKMLLYQLLPPTPPQGAVPGGMANSRLGRISGSSTPR